MKKLRDGNGLTSKWGAYLYLADMVNCGKTAGGHSDLLSFGGAGLVSRPLATTNQGSQVQNRLTAAGQRQILTALSPLPLTADPRQNRQ